MTNLLIKDELVDGDYLRDIDHRVFGQSRLGYLKQHIAGCHCETQIARNDDSNDRRNPAGGKGIGLNELHRAAIAGSRVSGLRAIGPLDLTALNYQASWGKARA